MAVFCHNLSRAWGAKVELGQNSGILFGILGEGNASADGGDLRCMLVSQLCGSSDTLGDISSQGGCWS